MAKKKQRKPTYWERRSIEEEEKLKQASIIVEDKVINAYLKAQNYLTSEVKKIYQRYLNKTDKTEAEVKQILNTSVEPAELVRLKQLTKDISNQELRIESQNYLNGLAVKHRITRLEDLKAKSYLVSKQVADVQLDKQTDFYIDTIHEAYNKASAEAIIGKTDKSYKLTDDGKYKSYAVKNGKLVLELTDKETNKVLDTVKIKPDEPVTEFKELSTKYTKNVLESNWQGSNYSKRIWNDTELLAKRLEELFTVESMTGMSEQEMTKKIADEFETSIYVARRLIRTEANYMANQAKLKGWKAHGVEEYVIVAVLDLRTSTICKGKDGKIYKVSEAICNGKEGNYPPFHPWCRTVVRAYFGKQSLQGTRIANDPITGKTFTINHSDAYRQWEKMLLDKHGEKDLDIAKTKVKNYRSDLAQFNRYKSIIGTDNTPKSFDKFQEMKYNDGSEWDDLKELYREVNWMKSYQSDITEFKEAKRPFEHKPKSVIDEFINGDHVYRRYYGITGKPRLDIDFTDHATPTIHNNPHAHTWTYEQREHVKKEIPKHHGHRELTLAEKIANERREKVE